jgi:hypothetical protein
MIKKVLPICCILLLPGSLLFALDFSVIAGAGNFSFNTRAEEPLGTGDFSGSVYPFGRATVTDTISKIIAYSVSLERDPVLRNTLSGEVTVTAGFLSFSVGPLFGLFSTWESPLKPGIAAGIGLDFPGIIFASIRGGATFGSLYEKGDYTLETGGITLGFWLPHLVNTFSMTTKKFSMFRTDTLLTEDHLLRFCYRAEIYSKGVPYTVFIDMGYQILSRSYDDPQVSGKDTFHALFLGFEAALTVRPLFTVLFGVETPVYSWGQVPLTRADHAWFIQGFAGFKWTIEKKSEL